MALRLLVVEGKEEVVAPSLYIRWHESRLVGDPGEGAGVHCPCVRRLCVKK